jgi:hypothetical protein
MKRILSVAAVVLVALVVLAASAHAAAGEMPHVDNCLACGLCEWLHSLLLT